MVVNRRLLLRLVVGRVLLMLAAGFVPGLIAMSTVRNEVATHPWFVEAPRPLPLLHLFDVFAAIRPALMAAVLFAVLFAAAEHIYTVGAVALTRPGPDDEARANRSRYVFVELWRAMSRLGGPAIRVSLWLAPLALVVVVGTFTTLDFVTTSGHSAGWTALTLFVVAPAVAMILMGFVLALVGAWSFWSRFVIGADERTTSRRAVAIAAKVILRRPLATVGIYLAYTLTSHFLHSALAVIVRQAAPLGLPELLPWLGLDLLVLVVTSLLWYALLRHGHNVYGRADMAVLREAPDEGFAVWRRTVAWIRRKRR